MIVLDHAPYTPFDNPRTAGPPGLSPLDPDEWTVVHADFAAQMAYRARILAEHRDLVLACQPQAAAAVDELLEAILALLGRRGDYAVGADLVRRPDGVTVPIDRAAPLETLNALAAEDFCVMLPDPGSGEYRLAAAILCFPSRWLLAEKLGRPLTMIHDPVPDYDDVLARRINRVFETLRPERPLVRVNWILHSDPELFVPLGREGGPARTARTRGDGPLYLRTERQTLVRLPRTGAVVFGIKTSVTPVTALDPATLAVLATAFAEKARADHDYGATREERQRTLDRLSEMAGQAPAGAPSSPPK